MLWKGKDNIATYIGAALLGGIIMYLAWPPFHLDFNSLHLNWPPLNLNFLVFIGLIPVLMMEDRIRNNYSNPSLRLFAFSMLFFLLWNIFTTWWIWYASAGGAILAIVCNALLMSLPVMFYHRVRQRLPRIYGYIALCVFWLGFEYFHLNWDGNWPWLNLGNCWAGSPDWVQWYEYTGAMGGTLWIWIVNILIYESIRRYKPGKMTSKGYYRIFAIAFFIGFPVVISYAIKPENPAPLSTNVVAVQPNIDPYNEKFSGNTEQQITKLIRLSEKAMDTNTRLVVWPETAISQEINEKNIEMYSSIAEVRAFLRKHPGTKLISGLNSFAEYTTEAEKTESAHKSRDKNTWYDIFNAGVLMDTTSKHEIYHKSRLVPGVEVIPFEHLLGFLGSFAIDMGAGGGSLGTQKEPSVFAVNNELKAAPVICYESIFGEYVSQYIKKGANVITIFTNDGWWYNTDGYKQHAAYARLRAIEDRKFVVRSANTGISCFILPNGEVQQPTAWWVEASIKSPIYIDNRQTFYCQHGDYLGRISLWTSLVYLVSMFTFRLITRIFKRS